MATEGEWYFQENEIFDGHHYSMAICNHAYDDGNEIAHRIITAVNCHDELVGRLESITKRFGKAVMSVLEQHGNSVEQWPEWMSGCRGEIELADAVLAKAKGE